MYLSSYIANDPSFDISNVSVQHQYIDRGEDLECKIKFYFSSNHLVSLDEENRQGEIIVVFYNYKENVSHDIWADVQHIVYTYNYYKGKSENDVIAQAVFDMLNKPLNEKHSAMKKMITNLIEQSVNESMVSELEYLDDEVA